VGINSTRKQVQVDAKATPKFALKVQDVGKTFKTPQRNAKSGNAKMKTKGGKVCCATRSRSCTMSVDTEYVFLSCSLPYA